MLRRLIGFTSTFLLLANPALAELRKPTAAEQAVLQKYRDVINKVLDQFQSDDWDESVDFSVDDEVTVHTDSGRPLDVDELSQRTYRVRNGSARFNNLILPVLQKIEQEPDPFKKGEVAKPIQNLNSLQVEVHFNIESLGINPPPASNHDLHIPGTAMAYPVSDNALSHGSAYVLAFGNWKGLKWDADHGWYHFHFAHPQNTPYIENIEIRIFGADDRIQELFHAIDWNQVNAALTP
jgi:hypothetical protein